MKTMKTELYLTFTLLLILSVSISCSNRAVTEVVNDKQEVQTIIADNEYSNNTNDSQTETQTSLTEDGAHGELTTQPTEENKDETTTTYFDKYDLGLSPVMLYTTTCSLWRNNGIAAHTVYVINSKEEFTMYFLSNAKCPDDFDNYTLLFVYGTTTSCIGGQTFFNISQDSDLKYSIEATVETGACAAPDAWYCAALVPKVPDDTVVAFTIIRTGMNLPTENGL
jgi:hypothetical protein